MSSKRRGPSKRHIKRLKIFALIEEGYNDTDIAARASVDRATVWRWRKKKKEADKAEKIEDEELVLSQPRAGRPITATTSPIRRKIIKMTEGKTRRSTRKVAKTLKSQGTTISRTSVRRVLRSDGLHPYRRQKQPRLTQRHKMKRRTFARNHKDHDWEHTLMTDEKDFELFPTGNPQNDRVWARSAADVPARPLVKHSASVSVWGGISANGTTNLHFYKGTINTNKYLEILKKMKPEAEALFGDHHWTFQHDGASAHKSKKTNAWLENNVPAHITSGPTGEWPANSPDLNTTENVWAILEDKLDENPPKTIPQLKRRLKKAWNELDHTVLANLAKSMDRRLRDVLAKKGGYVG